MKIHTIIRNFISLSTFMFSLSTAIESERPSTLIDPRTEKARETLNVLKTEGGQIISESKKSYVEFAKFLSPISQDEPTLKSRVKRLLVKWAPDKMDTTIKKELGEDYAFADENKIQEINQFAPEVFHALDGFLKNIGSTTKLKESALKEKESTTPTEPEHPYNFRFWYDIIKQSSITVSDLSSGKKIKRLDFMPLTTKETYLPFTGGLSFIIELLDDKSGNVTDYAFIDIPKNALDAQKPEDKGGQMRTIYIYVSGDSVQVSGLYRDETKWKIRTTFVKDPQPQVLKKLEPLKAEGQTILEKYKKGYKSFAAFLNPIVHDKETLMQALEKYRQRWSPKKIQNTIEDELGELGRLIKDEDKNEIIKLAYDVDDSLLNFQQQISEGSSIPESSEEPKKESLPLKIKLTNRDEDVKGITITNLSSLHEIWKGYLNGIIHIRISETGLKPSSAIVELPFEPLKISIVPENETEPFYFMIDKNDLDELQAASVENLEIMEKEAPSEEDIEKMESGSKIYTLTGKNKNNAKVWSKDYVAIMAK